MGADPIRRDVGTTADESTVREHIVARTSGDRSRGFGARDNSTGVPKATAGRVVMGTETVDLAALGT